MPDKPQEIAVHAEAEGEVIPGPARDDEDEDGEG